MAITTYSELQSAIANWHVRGNIAAGRIQEFIYLFEAYANRVLRVSQMETSATITMSSGSGSLPSDYLTWRSVTWGGSTPRDLEYRDRTWITENFASASASDPSYFTIEGSTITVTPTSDTSLTFKYYQKIPNLSDSATTNWLLTAHPDLYLFGSLVESNSFIRAPMGAVWKQRRDDVIDEINRLQFQSKGPAQIVVKGKRTP